MHAGCSRGIPKLLYLQARLLAPLLPQPGRERSSGRGLAGQEGGRRGGGAAGARGRAPELCSAQPGLCWLAVAPGSPALVLTVSASPPALARSRARRQTAASLGGGRVRAEGRLLTLRVLQAAAGGSSSGSGGVFRSPAAKMLKVTVPSCSSSCSSVSAGAGSGNLVPDYWIDGSNRDALSDFFEVESELGR